MCSGGITKWNSFHHLSTLLITLMPCTQIIFFEFGDRTTKESLDGNPVCVWNNYTQIHVFYFLKMKVFQIFSSREGSYYSIVKLKAIINFYAAFCRTTDGIFLRLWWDPICENVRWRNPTHQVVIEKCFLGISLH